MHRTALAPLAVAAALALPALSSGQSSSLPALDVSTTGSAITVAGTPQSGASTVNLTNGTKKPATITFVRLEPGVTEDQLVAALPKVLRDPNEIAPYGTILFDSGVAPGSAAVDTVLTAGDYVAFDSTASNPSKWTHTSFTVAASAADALLPKAGATITAIDYAFKAPKSVKRGTTVRFVQGGHTVHMIAALKVQNAFVAKRVVRFLRAGKDKKVEPLARGFADFMAPASSGAVQQVELDAAPGQYVLVCFMPTQDGREHTRLGMARPLKITK